MSENPTPEPVPKLIERLSLQRHPEGGWYRETHRSPIMLPGEALPPDYSARDEGYSGGGGGGRCAVTSILFLLTTGERSRLHRVRSEEIWLHQMGDDLSLRMDESDRMERPRRVVLGQGDEADLQAVVPRNWWQEAEALPGPAGFALVGCVVAPGFEFEDFELAEP